MKLRPLLSFILSLQIFLAPMGPWNFAFAQGTGIAGVQSAFTTYSQQPFNEAEAQKFLQSVTQNQEALKATPEGQNLIRKANRARMLLAMKRNLDKCFGGDILQLESAKNVMESAFNSEVDPDCAMSSAAFEDLDTFTSDLEAWIAADNSGEQETRRADLRKALFVNTALRAAEAETRLRTLFSDPIDVPGLLESMCGANGSGCPADFVAQYRARSDQFKQRLTEAGYRPMTDQAAAQHLSGEIRKMYDAVYDPSLPYHASQTSPERWEAFRPDDGDAPEYFRPDGAGRLTFQPYPNALTQPGLTPEDYQRFESELNASIERSIPAQFYEQQQTLQSNQYGIALATSLDWARALGHGMTVKPIPMVWGQSGVMVGPVSNDRRHAETALPVHDYVSMITADSVRSNRQTSLQRLNDTIGEMGKRIFANDTADAQDDLKMLFTANPRAAGELMLTNPKNLDLFCETFQGIKSDENFDKYMTWGLVGLTIGAAIFTGGASLLGAGALATAGGATLATVGAVDMLYGATQGMQELEMGQLQHAVCVSEGPNSQACLDYQSQINSAMTSFALAGVGATGMGPFMRTLSRMGRGTGELLRDSVAALPRVAEYLKGPGARLVRGLTEDQKGILMAHLSQLTDAERAALAARTNGLSDTDLAAFNRRLLDRLESGADFTDIVAEITPEVESPLRIPGNEGDDLRPASFDSALAPGDPSPQSIFGPASPMADDAFIKNADGTVVPGPGYNRELIRKANELEDIGYNTVIMPPKGDRTYSLLCIEGGNLRSVIARVAASKGIGSATICVDPFITHLGAYHSDENLIRLSGRAFKEAHLGQGFILLHEARHASALRRALAETGKPNSTEAFIPYGRLHTVKDPTLTADMTTGDPSVYLREGFSFDELHSFQRHITEMTSAFRRGETGVDEDLIRGSISTLKQNSIVLNRFADEALAAYRSMPRGTNVAPNGFHISMSYETVKVDGIERLMGYLTISKPLKMADGTTQYQQMSIYIPPSSGDFSKIVERQLERLALRSRESYEAAMRQEHLFEYRIPIPPKKPDDLTNPHESDQNESSFGTKNSL